MCPKMINSETICDRQGQPLHPASATLLKALDKLLTVGAYYSAEHSQYLQAARQARDAIVGVIGGPGQCVAIEITAQGLLIGRQNLDPHHRNVRLLHDLLVPLNIARLEIDGALTPEDLRQALAALQRHKAALGQTNSFQEIVIEDLPDSVRAVSCSVLSRSEVETNEGGLGDGVSLDELLGKWDESGTDGGVAPADNDSAHLARQFLDLVTEILANLEALADESGIAATDGPEGSYVTVADLMELKQTLENLVAVNPDPAELARLISQAQQALGLSRDAESVDLVFQILKKDMTKEEAAPPPKKKKPAPVTYKYTVAQLFEHVAELAAEPVPVPEPWPGSRANQLGIGLHLLRSDPPRSLRTALIETVEMVVEQPDFAAQNLVLYAQAAATVVDKDNLDGADDLLPVFTGTLRQKHPALISLFWGHVLDESDDAQLEILWPHLVNDILLGLNRAPREVTIRLATAAGGLPLKVAQSQGHRLEKQPALQGRSAERDLLVAPLAEVQNVLAMLLASSLKDWLGEEIFHALRKAPPSRLVDLTIAALGDHDPQNNGFYLQLIRHGQDQEPPASLREPTAGILQSRLENLAPGSREAEWVPDALTELARLAPDQARPLLERVQNQKRFFFFKAWPASARGAAARALEPADTEVP